MTRLRRNCNVTCSLTYLSLGAGVQSSTLALMFSRDAVAGHRPPDVAIFADTGDEPQAVYDWLHWLIPRLAFPVYIVQKEQGIRTHVLASIGARKRYAGPPVYTESTNRRGVGMLKRQCTSEFKIAVIHQQVRASLGLAFHKHARTYYEATGYIGISLDEVERMKPARVAWVEHQWPLIDAGLTRQDCLAWMAANGYPTPPKSACRICPYRTNAEWLQMKTEAPADFAAAVEVDHAIRAGVRGTRQRLYLHESLQPLDQVDFSQPNTGANPRFAAECAGICSV